MAVEVKGGQGWGANPMALERSPQRRGKGGGRALLTHRLGGQFCEDIARKRLSSGRKRTVFTSN